MKVTFIKARNTEFSTDKHELYNENGFIKIKRKVAPRFEAFVSVEAENIILEDIIWIDEATESKKQSKIKTALAFIRGYYYQPRVGI